MNNIFELKNRNEFRDWLKYNCDKCMECWLINLQRGKIKEDNKFYYIDAVEEALCFGWIDSVYKNIDGVTYQKFTPRKKNSNWTVLNKARCKRLINIGLMTEHGLKVMPKLEYEFDEQVLEDIKQANIYDEFIKFPILYQKIRVFNLASIRTNSIEAYKKSFINFVEKTKANKMYGEWNDCGRLENIEI